MGLYSLYRQYFCERHAWKHAVALTQVRVWLKIDRRTTKALNGSLYIFVGMIIDSLIITAFAICGCNSQVFTRPRDLTPSKITPPDKFKTEWGGWSSWSPCSQECDGKRLRLRVSIGGIDHQTDHEEQSCNLAGDTIKCLSKYYWVLTQAFQLVNDYLFLCCDSSEK
mgnify:CR=1 FL=1